MIQVYEDLETFLTGKPKLFLDDKEVSEGEIINENSQKIQSMEK